ncbi:MAG: hypothetical protein AB1817_15620, partial [Chloroflexota bacterium]
TGYGHVRRYMSGIYSRQAYLRDLLKHARRKGIQVWVEIKELEFPDEVLEKFPQLWKNGFICPTEPVWFEYLNLKTEEFFELFPDMAGIILSPGSPESRAFLSAGKKCNCERCQATDFGDWCHDIIMAIYDPVKARAKQLAVRDFVYTPEDHERLAKVINRLPKDIAFCIKKTPRDFWPTFPNNAMFGRFKDRPQWIEYDTFGQFYGWGVCPSIMLDDLRDRLAYAKSQGATGALIRTEWEGVDVSAFDHVNKINLIGAAQFTQNMKEPNKRIVLRWLREEGLLKNRPASAIDVNGLTRFLLKTWQVMRKTIYIDDFVFASSSQIPIDVNKAWFMMAFYHCLSTWDPSAAGRLDLNHTNLQRLMAEKDDAVKLVRELIAYLNKHDFGLPPATHRYLKGQFQFYDMYVRGFGLSAKACLLAKALKDGTVEPARQAELRAAQEKILQGLTDYIEELKTFEETTSHPSYVYLLLNHRNAQGILDQAREMFAK